MTTVQETFPVAHSLPLRLSFCPQAIREHFGNCETVQEMTDEQLCEVGHDALIDDELYETFNSVLRRAMEDLHGFDPDTADEEDDDEA